MQISQPSQGSLQQIKYLFVDGGYFRERVKALSEEYFKEPSPTLDYSKLAGDHYKAFYYDCLPQRKAKETNEEYELRTKNERELFNSMRLCSGWHVVEGVVKGEGGKARQKEVDIRIAVDMLTHSHLRNMEKVSFIAGDQDFKPLVDAVVREGTFIDLWYVKEHVSLDLLLSADSRTELDVYWLYSIADRNFQKKHSLPARVSTPESNKKIERQGTLKEKTLNGSDEVYLWDVKDEYIIAQPSRVNEGYTDHLSFPDLGMLKKIYEVKYGKVIWEKA